MAKKDTIEEVINKTFKKVSEQGFEADRVQAILNRTELSLKKQVDNFGWNVILSLTPGWNHIKDPLTLLTINADIERFKTDLQDGNFLKEKVQKYFLDNQHKLILTMSPQDDYVGQQQQILDNLEDRLVKGLNAEQQQMAIDQGKLLDKMQSEKDSEEVIRCLPTLSVNEDMPESLPR
jgi:Zn-dependent M16 (insulinase) family peptidase